MNDELRIICGPTASGKSSIERRMIEYRGFNRVVSCTTRAMRDGEVDGGDYTFLSRAEFEAAYERGDIIEKNEFAGNLYGVPKQGILDALAGGNAVLVVDVNGVEALLDRPYFAKYQLDVVYVSANFFTLVKRVITRDGWSLDLLKRILEIIICKLTWKRRLRKATRNFYAFNSTHTSAYQMADRIHWTVEKL